MLGLDATEYQDGLATIQRQTNNRAGLLSRTSISFIVATLKDARQGGLALSRAELRSLWRTYPTIFTLDEGLVAARLKSLQGPDVGYSAQQVKRILVDSGRPIFYHVSRHATMLGFLQSRVGLTRRQATELCARETRLISVSLEQTIGPKWAQLCGPGSKWGLGVNKTRDAILTYPTILTTPPSTTQALWEYLTEDLQWKPEQAQHWAGANPGVFRINARRSVAPKVALVLAAELFTTASMVAVSTEEPTGVVGSVGNEKEKEKEKEESESGGFSETAADLLSLLRAMSFPLLLQSPLVCTFSPQRISKRMTSAASICSARSTREWQAGAGAT